MSFPVLGTAQLGMAYGIANKTGAPDFKQALNIVAHAVENGVEEIDTAQVYGHSEAFLGRIISTQHFSKPLKITTKIDHRIDHLNTDQMKLALTGSLKRLETEQIYCYMLHGDEQTKNWDAGLKEILMGFKNENLIKHIGVSVYSPENALLAIETEHIDIIQIPSNILDRRFETNHVFDQARKHKKKIYVRSIFLQGLLLMNEDDLPDHMRFAKPALKKLKTISEKLNFSTAELSIAYAKQAYPDSGIIFGAETLTQVKENLRIWRLNFPESIKTMAQKELPFTDEKLLNPSKWQPVENLAILQARISSSRLPGKVMQTILGRPLLELQIERIQRSGKISKLIVATSINEEDNEIAALCRKIGVDCFRGNLENVLDRFYQAARYYNAKNIVRLTGDCPLTDPEKIDELIDFFHSGKMDYASNCGEGASLPDGLDAEIFSMKALETAWKNASLPSEKEHVCPYITNKSNGFVTGYISGKKDLSHLRWCVDEPEDFEFVRQIYKYLYMDNPKFNTSDILILLEKYPDLQKINTGFSRNIGYQKSLQQDMQFLNTNKN